MKQNIFIPKSLLEKFGMKVYDLLVENSQATFFVGGMVRDILLNRKIVDVDIATALLPQNVVQILTSKNIFPDEKGAQFGTIGAVKNNYVIDITTFRRDEYGTSRYPKINFSPSARRDSMRRDFTINSLYLNPKTGEILDFNHGLRDLKRKNIAFIGNPKKRVQEDPLRIVRALRFALILDFSIEKNSLTAIKNNFSEIKILSQNKISQELSKLEKKSHKTILANVLKDRLLLDKYFPPDKIK